MDNKEILNFVNKHGGELLKNNFLGVFPIDSLAGIVKNIETKDYPICIFNTDPSNEPGTHWCVTHILNDTNGGRLSLFIFDSFGKTGLLTFL